MSSTWTSSAHEPAAVAANAVGLTIGSSLDQIQLLGFLLATPGVLFVSCTDPISSRFREAQAAFLAELRVHPLVGALRLAPQTLHSARAGGPTTRTSGP